MEENHEGMKKCPYCAEWIKAEAIKCKHCWSMLEPKDIEESEVPLSQRTLCLEPAPDEQPAFEPVEIVTEGESKVEVSDATDSEKEPVKAVKWWETTNFKKAMYVTGGAAVIVIVIFLGIYGLRALWVLTYIALGLTGLGILIALTVAASASKAGSSLTGRQCKYCGKQLSGQDLINHIHAEHEEQYQKDLSKPIAGGTYLRMSPSLSSQNTRYVKPKRVCPTCGSTRVDRFSRTWKVTKVATVGVFGLGNVHKIFKCKDCGYKW